MTTQRKPKRGLRNVWEGICYITKTGCQWRSLPENYPPWQTVYWYSRKWALNGTIEIAHQEISKALYKQAGKNDYCSIGIIDSSSDSMNAKSWHSKGGNGNKKINRHLRGH